MFCTKCGTENPADAEFCYKCGKLLFAPQSSPSDRPPTIAETVSAASTPSFSEPASRHESADGAAGLTIIHRKKMEVALVWVSVSLSALGILLRGLIPLDILLWMVGLTLAIWYTRKVTLFLKVAQPEQASEPLAQRTNSWLDGDGVGLAVVLIVAILFLFPSLAKWTGGRLASRPASGATANREHRENLKRTMTPEESKVLQAADLMTLRLNEVIARCGKPRTDTTQIFEEAKIKGLLRRDVSYTNEKGSVVTLVFWKAIEKHDWDFIAMFDGGVEYRAEDSDHILSALPCLAG